jgi:hypothetical protein
LIIEKKFAQKVSEENPALTNARDQYELFIIGVLPQTRRGLAGMVNLNLTIREHATAAGMKNNEKINIKH